MSNSLVLSIFPGIDLLGRAFEEEGWCIVRGPDVIWGGDVLTPAQRTIANGECPRCGLTLRPDGTCPNGCKR